MFAVKNIKTSIIWLTRQMGHGAPRAPRSVGVTSNVQFTIHAFSNVIYPALCERHLGRTVPLVGASVSLVWLAHLNFGTLLVNHELGNSLHGAHSPTIQHFLAFEVRCHSNVYRKYKKIINILGIYIFKSLLDALILSIVFRT